MEVSEWELANATITEFVLTNALPSISATHNHSPLVSSQIVSVSPAAVDDSHAQLEYIQKMISYVLNGYLTAFCVFTGVFLNILCIVVFLRYRYGNTPIIQYYLVTLTIWQTLLLCNAFLMYSLPTLIYGYVVWMGRYVYLYPYAYALANTTHTGSVWIVLTLTIDRYLALCRPLTHRAIGKRSRVKRLMMAVSAFAVLFSMPRFFEVHVVPACHESIIVNLTVCEPTISRTELTENKTYWSIYHIFLAMMFVTLVPCVLLFALTLTISLALRKAIVKRKSLCAPNAELDGRNKKKTSTRKEHKSNIMLVLVIAKFLISDILPTVADVLEHIVGNQVFMHSALATVFVDFSNFLLVLNCSTNFWVFLLGGRRFQRSCKQLLTSTSIGYIIYSKLSRISNEPEIVSTYYGPSSYVSVANTSAKINGGCYNYGSDGTPGVMRKGRQSNGESAITVIAGESTHLNERFRRSYANVWEDYETRRMLAVLANENRKNLL